MDRIQKDLVGYHVYSLFNGPGFPNGIQCPLNGSPFSRPKPVFPGQGRRTSTRRPYVMDHQLALPQILEPENIGNLFEIGKAAEIHFFLNKLDSSGGYARILFIKNRSGKSDNGQKEQKVDTTSQLIPPGFSDCGLDISFFWSTDSGNEPSPGGSSV